jgi:hypothetical protein
MSLGCVYGSEIVMAVYQDLSPYEYSPTVVEMVNVGWLGRDSVYPTGVVDARVQVELLKRAADPANVMRGFHYCEFCDEDSPIRIPAKVGIHERVSLGTGEIRVAGDDGVIYAAPTLIVHYIEKHGYRPPEAFIVALIGAAD